MRKKVPKGWLKISEFEKLTGISNKTITAAIKSGKIPSAYVDRVGVAATAPYYLDPKKAADEWCSKININHQLSRPLRETLLKYISTFKPSLAKPYKSDKDTKQTPAPSGVMTMADAQLKERIAKAQIAELELKEKDGTLVSKELVDSELFAAAQEIRNSLLAIPDRIIDQVIAEATSRNKAYNTLYNAIAAELEKLADIGARIER